MPWENDLCFRVRGKIFTTLALADGRFPRVTFKCAPETFHDLLEIAGISPAAYVGRYKWVTIADSKLLPENELKKLIQVSYILVAAKAPNRKAARKKSSSKRRAK